MPTEVCEALAEASDVEGQSANSDWMGEIGDDQLLKRIDLALADYFEG